MDGRSSRTIGNIASRTVAVARKRIQLRRDGVEGHRTRIRASADVVDILILCSAAGTPLDRDSGCHIGDVMR